MITIPTQTVRTEQSKKMYVMFQLSWEITFIPTMLNVNYIVDLFVRQKYTPMFTASIRRCASQLTFQLLSFSAQLLSVLQCVNRIYGLQISIYIGSKDLCVLFNLLPLRWLKSLDKCSTAHVTVYSILQFSSVLAVCVLSNHPSLLKIGMGIQLFFQISLAAFSHEHPIY